MKKINMIFIALLLILHSTLVYAYKPYNTKNSEVINTAPVGNINANSYKKTVDLVVMTDYTKDKLSNLQSALNNFKSDMFSKNINVNIKILNRKTKLDNFKKINTKGYTVDVYQTGFGPGWSDYIYNIAKIVNGKVYFRISRYYNDNWNPIQYKSFNVVNEINNAIQVKFLSMNTIEVLDKYGNVYKVTYTDNEDTTKYTIQQYDKSILQPDEKIIKISIYNGLSMCLTDKGRVLYDNNGSYTILKNFDGNIISVKDICDSMILDFNGNIYFFGQHKYNVYGNETIDYFDFEKIAANAELILEYEDYNYNYNYWYTTDNIILTNNGVVKKIDIKYQYFIGRQLELNNTYIPYNNNFYINDIGNIKYDGFNYYCILGKDNYPYIININNGSITKIPQSGFKFTLDFGIKNNYTMGTYTYTGGIVILNSTDSNFSYPDFEDADMPQSHLSADIIDVDEIQDYTYSDNSEKYLLIVADGEGNNYKQGFGNYFSLGNINIKLGKYLNNKRFNILAVCPSNMYDYILPENKNQEITIRKLLDFSFKEGKLYGKGEYQQALNYIISECYSTPTNDLKIILNEEAVNYNTTYDDYEKDNKMSERWKYIHDPNYFENSNGIFNDSGKWLLNPIINFDKVGKYTVTYNVRDNPTINDAFDNYRLWSIGQNQLNIFVHRRPIADFEPVITENNSTSLLNIIDKSYDLDHLSKANKGIVERRFKWKRYEDTTWTDGLPMTISKSDIILINLIVKDEEGAWSLPVTKSIAFNLSIDANPTYCDWRNSSITPVISVTGSLSIFKEAQYIWTNSTDKPSDTAGWIKSTSTSIPALQNQEGVWYLHMKAIDVDGNVIYRYRGSYKIDLTPPNINAVPSSGEIEKEKNIAIGITDNLSGVKEAWYKWATSNSSMSNLTGFTKFTASPIKTPSDGTYYLHIKAYDNAGNVNYKIFGPYVVDELSVIASVAPNPAKRGQKVVFTINTKGYAKYLKITFPSEIWALDMTTPINLTIPEQVSRTDYVPYYLPLKTPMTLNDNGRLRQPYIIQIEAKKANGKIKTTTVNLDVKGSILDSIKTEIKCNY